MKKLKHFLNEALNADTITLSQFVDILRDAKYRHDDIDARAFFICQKVDIKDDITAGDLNKLTDAIQAFYDADAKYRSNMDSFLSRSPRGLSALFKFTSFEDDAVKTYEPVKKARNAAYDTLCSLITKYKGGKVSESILEAKKVSTPMEEAIQMALVWEGHKQKDDSDDKEKEFTDLCIFWSIVYGLDQEGKAWAKEMYDRSADASHSNDDKEKFIKEITGSTEFKMILAEISKIYNQGNKLQEILDTSSEPADDEDSPFERTLTASAQKAYDLELKKFEKMKQDFIDKCRAIN
jgi:hypothetical protein